MANTFLDEKISSFIEDKFPEFVKDDHPTFVEFLRLYYQFLESAKVTISQVQLTDNLLLENLLTDNFLLSESGDKFYTEDSLYGVFEKGENVTGLTSGAVSTILAEDNANTALYIEQNRHFQVGEVIVGATSAARATISKYQGNPVQNIQQLLEYVNIDRTITDFFDQFKDSYLIAIPDTLASGVSKRNLVKNIRDMYRAKGSKKGHELFFRLLFSETPELSYPTDNLLKISAGDWTSDTIIRIVAVDNDPINLAGQVVTQTINAAIGASTASATVESVIRLQEGENTIYQLLLNIDTIDGTFISGATVSGIDNSNPDISITGTVQTIVTDASVSTGGSLYTIEDSVTATSTTGSNAVVEVVDVGSGEVDEIIIDKPGIGYTVGTDLYFNNANTEGSAASAKITCVGGAISPEAGDISLYEMVITDHIVYEDATEQNDAYTGNQIMFETQTFESLGDQPENGAHHVAHGYYGSQIDAEAGNVVNITMFNGGSGYEKLPPAVPTSAKLYWSTTALSTSGIFQQGEIVTNASSVSSTIAVLGNNYMSVANASGSYSVGDVITGGTSGAKATLVTGTVTHGTGAVFLGFSQEGIGSVKGVEIKKFGSGYTTAPTLTLPVKLLLSTKYDGVNPHANAGTLTSAAAFAANDIVTGGNSSAAGVVTAWDQNTQVLTVKMTASTFQVGEPLTRGSTTNYANVAKFSRSILNSTVGTKGTTAGAYDSDKGKVSESLMKIQDSYYYQDFSYVVKVGAAIKDWRGSVKKAVHPAGFAVFGEVSLANQVSARMTTPPTLATGLPVDTETPTLASLFEAVLSTVVGRRLGTQSDGTTLRSNAHLAHQVGQLADIKSITLSGTVATVITQDPHGIEAGEEVEISGVTSSVTVSDVVYTFDGVWTVASVTGDSTFTYSSVNASLPATAVLGTNATVRLPSPFDSDTRDVTLRAHYDIPVTIEILSGFDQLQKNRYGMGSTKRTASRYMWATGAIDDTSPVKQTNLEYAYPGVTRRQVPHIAEDNVTAGGSAVYNSTMGYINIQVGAHEQNVHMTLEQFADVRIDEIIRPDRILAEDGTPGMGYQGNDRDYFISEDDSNTVIESLDIHTDVTIPTESAKLWNVPPPSYIRGISSTTGAWVTFDDNTTPPDFSDNTIPPSFDATSGT